MPTQNPITRILLVDDDQLILESISRLLLRHGWDVDICQHGNLALQKIQLSQYDCVLMDIRMPELTGTDALREIRKLEVSGGIKRQNVIMMTGYADEDATIKAFQLEAANYISKPFDVQELLKKIEISISANALVEALGSPAAAEDEEKIFKKIRKSYDTKSMREKINILSKKINVPLKHIGGCTYDTEFFRGNIENPLGVIQIPLGLVGPVPVRGKNAVGDFYVPMATTEGALLLTYDLGARLAEMAGGVNVEVLSKVVHITPMFPIQTSEAATVSEFVNQNYENIKKVAEGDSQHTKLLGIEQRVVGRNFLLKFKYDTGDAQGLNMINHASFHACKYIEAKTGAKFYHRSHYSGVKHYSPTNERDGYGRVVKASAVISGKALGFLRVTAGDMKDFFDRCRECGQSAGIRSVNVHAANAIAAIFLACGQDAADLSSAHVCDTSVDLVNGNKDLKIEVILRNLLLATVGGGTVLGTQRECLSIMDCVGTGKADKLAEIIAATVLVGEYPTAAAVINRTYVDIHNKYGRNRTVKL